MGNRIKELREGKNLTQDDLAKLVRTSKQTIVSLENGKYTPSIMLTYKISKIFNKKIEEIFIIFDK